MTNISPISAPSTPWLTATPRTRDTAQAAPTAAPRAADAVELSPQAIRADLVARIKEQIKAGTYETPEKLDQAIDGLARDLQG